MNGLTTSELTDRVRAQGHKTTEFNTVQFLEDWERQGVVEKVDGGWRLTESGRAQFGFWCDEVIAA